MTTSPSSLSTEERVRDSSEKPGTAVCHTAREDLQRIARPAGHAIN
ncbi:MAG: hypothetical protein Q7T76_16560 [Ferruginibacter sp.]|nr:hypothetical protein [Ferruginibacter sp.]